MKLAVIADFAEEGWPSMDLCASELMRHIPSSISASLIQPKMRTRLSRLLGIAGSNDSIHILDRLWNRQWDYPRYARHELVAKFDAFHVVDHSYAAVAHSLPGERNGVYCHVLDAFRCILEPTTEKRPLWFRAMSRRILIGLKKAAIVFHNSMQTGEALRRFDIVSEERLIHAPLGTAEEFCIEAKNPASSRIGEAIEKFSGRPVLLHVGSNIPRKRIDVLLRVLSLVRQRVGDVVLVKVGDRWTSEQDEMIGNLGVGNSIVHLGKLERIDLATCYRRANAVVIPSDAEGFGLPVIEAMACGAAVVASDVPVLRETGGEAASFAPVGDIDAWVDRVEQVLQNGASVPSQAARLAWASKFSWSEHARIIADAYRRIL